MAIIKKIYDGSEVSQLIHNTNYPSMYLPPKLIKAGNYWFVSMDLNSGDNAYVLKSTDLTTWTNTSFPTNKNYSYSKIAKDSNNNIYVVTYESSERVIYVHKYNGISWTTEALQQLTGGEQVSDSYICIDSNNIPHVICTGTTTKKLLHNYISGGEWTTWEEIGVLNRIQLHSICMDNNNNIIHVAIWGRTTSESAYEIKYIKGSRGNWGSFETVLENPRSNETQMVVLNNGTVYIVCARAEGASPTDSVLTVVYGSSSNWNTSSLLEGDDKTIQSLSVTTDGDYVHLVCVDNYNYGVSSPMYYFHNINGSWISPIQLNSDDGQYASVYTTGEEIAIIFNNYDEDAVYVLIGSVDLEIEKEKFPILTPEYRGRIMICEYQKTISAEAGTSSTAIVCTAHNLNDGDFITNTTRKSISLAGAERGSRKIVKHDNDTLLLSDGVPILGQQEGDEIRLYKYIDRTNFVKVGSLSINLNTGNNGDANFDLVIPIE